MNGKSAETVTRTRQESLSDGAYGFFHPPRCDIDGATGTGSLQITISAVAKGPKNSETRNQTNLERFFCSAIPALTTATVNQKKPVVTYSSIDLPNHR